MNLLEESHMVKTNWTFAYLLIKFNERSTFSPTQKKKYIYIIYTKNIYIYIIDNKYNT